MNYINWFKNDPIDFGGVGHLFGCCAIGEAITTETNTSLPKSKVKKILHTAKGLGKTFLIWSVLPDLGYYQEIEKILKKLPNTTFVGSEINPNSGNRVSVYVTNLRAEWGPNDKLPDGF